MRLCKSLLPFRGSFPLSLDIWYKEFKVPRKKVFLLRKGKGSGIFFLGLRGKAAYDLLVITYFKCIASRSLEGKAEDERSYLSVYCM